MGFPGDSVVKNLPAMQEIQEICVQSPGQEDPLEGAVFLPGESHGQRNLEGCTVHGVPKRQTQLKQLSMQLSC